VVVDLDAMGHRLHGLPCISELLADLIPQKVFISVFVEDTQP
jgi:hypothetical protein